MPFMTNATVRNLPAYLADDRARRNERVQAAEREKLEEQQERMRNLGQTFMASGDFTPQGLQTFAKDNKMSMPEMKGMIELVTNFKQLNQQRKASLVNARPEGADYTERTVDQPGVRSYDKPGGATGGNIWARGQDGVQTRVPDTVGAQNFPAPKPGGADVPDYMKTVVTNLSKSLGYSQQTGWPDEASEQKFNTVLKNVDAKMQGADPASANQVLINEIETYDQGIDVADTIRRIPKDTLTTTVNDAKKAVTKALDAGALPEDVKVDLLAKGWSEKEVEKIIDQGKWGKRHGDNGQKANGYFGPLDMTDGSGRVATEISVTVNINGKETEIPTLVPTLTEAEKTHLLSGKKMTRAIVDKAVKHAKSRINSGKSPFASNAESSTIAPTTANPLGL